MQVIVAYLVSGAAFLALDMLWLGVVARGLYSSEMGALLANPIKLWAAIAFYAVYLVGLVVFAVLPGVNGQSVVTAAGYGALLGLVAYATYDLTALAVIRDFPVKLALVDIAWGVVVSSIAAAVAAAVALRF